MSRGRRRAATAAPLAGTTTTIMRPWTAAFAIVLIASVARAEAPPAPEPSAGLEALERRVDALGREVDRLRHDARADSARRTAPPLAPRFGLGPVAAKAYAARGALSVGGFGEARVTGFDRRREDGTLAGEPARGDLVRTVLVVGHRYDSTLLLDAALGIEHAGVTGSAASADDPLDGDGGALAGAARIEFAFLDWMPAPALGVRAGLLLVPVGLANEWREPPVVIGALRPDVETRVIPTTWSALGAGLHGELEHGVAYRAYVLEGLDGARFDAEHAIRNGRQDGARALLTHPSFAARLDWSGAPGVTIGGSGYTGLAWQGAPPSGARLAPRVTLLEAHARSAWRGIEARALYVAGTLSQASALSDAIGLTGAERLGKRFFGGYVEAAWDALGSIRPGSRLGLAPYARIEESDTQDGVDPPAPEDPSHHWNTYTAGLELRPHPYVALKAERQWRHTETDSGVGRWNASVGWMF